MSGESYRPLAVGFDGLATAIENAIAGRGSLVFVTGEPGMGKTTAAQDVAAAATAAGASPLWAACWQDDATAHAPWRSLLGDLGEAGGAALAVLSGTEQADPTSAAAARAGAYARVVDALTALARQQPLVVVLDDLHWADDGTIRLLAALRGRLPATPMLVVGTYRDNEVSGDSPLGELAAAADRVVLSPLGPTSVAEVIEGVIGRAPSDAVVVDVLRRTGGNPFLVVQVSRLLASGRAGELPAGARAVLSRRLDALAPDVRAVLDAAAVVNGPFRPSTLAAIVDRDVAETLDALDAAAAARVVERCTSGLGEWEFVHDLFRQAALDGLSSTRRADLHHRAARALIELGADSAAVAHQLLSAASGPDPEAADWALRAARDAVGELAWEEAALHAERALAVLPSGAEADELRAEAWLVDGQARLLSGDRSRAVAAFSTAAAIGRSLASPALVARAALGFAADLSGFEVQLFDQRQIDLLEEAATGLAGGDPSSRARVLARLSVALSFAAPTDRRLALAEQAVALARSGGDAIALAGALAAHCDAIAGPADSERRLAESTEIIDLAGRAGDGGIELFGRRLRFIAALELGDVAVARDEENAFERRAAEIGNPLYAWYVPLWHGMWALAGGEFAVVDDAIAEVERIGARASSTNAPMLALVLRAELCHQTRRLDELAEMVESIRHVMGGLFEMPQAFGNMGRYYSALGRVVEARAGLDRLLAVGVEVMPVDAEWLPGMVTLVDAAITLDHPVLERVIEGLVPYADRFAIDGIGGALHGSCAQFVARGLTALGRPDDAVPYARRALAANRGAGARLVAEAERTLAHALGSGPEADTLHASADSTFAAIGLTHLVQASAAPAAPLVSGDAVLRREGDVWHVTFAGTTTIVKHVKGMADLAMLLPRPGQEVHVTELEALPPEVATAARAAGRDETLDRQAVAAYRARLEELDGDLADAEAANDLVRAERARDERDFLLEELSLSLGLGGRARTAGPDPVERLRKAVTSRLRDAIRRIDAVHPTLARHLTNSVRTGTFCSYQPEQPVVWRCEGKSGA